MMETTMQLTTCEVYDQTRLPHYGCLDYAEGAEWPQLTAEQLDQYEAACQRFIDAEPEGAERYDYGIDLTVQHVDEAGAVVGTDITTFLPGDLRWSGMSAHSAAAKVAR
jgi:hypothetical protein